MLQSTNSNVFVSQVYDLININVNIIEINNKNIIIIKLTLKQLGIDNFDNRIMYIDYKTLPQNNSINEAHNKENEIMNNNIMNDIILNTINATAPPPPIPVLNINKNMNANINGNINGNINKQINEKNGGNSGIKYIK